MIHIHLYKKINYLDDLLKFQKKVKNCLKKNNLNFEVLKN